MHSRHWTMYCPRARRRRARSALMAALTLGALGASTLFLIACTYTPTPKPPVTPAPPDPNGFTCETARQNLAVLGGCGMDLVTFAKDCEDAERAERRAGVALPVGCLSTASECVAAEQCR